MTARNNPLTALSDAQIKMVEEIQCPGCTCGGAPAVTCPSFKAETGYGFACKAHSPGTLIARAGWMCPGLPKGFDKVGAFRAKGDDKRRNNLRLWIHPDMPDWDYLNVPVWAMEEEGVLYVRTYCPRINVNFVDVIQGGSMKDVPSRVHDVADFINEID